MKNCNNFPIQSASVPNDLKDSYTEVPSSKGTDKAAKILLELPKGALDYDKLIKDLISELEKANSRALNLETAKNILIAKIRRHEYTDGRIDWIIDDRDFRSIKEMLHRSK